MKDRIKKLRKALGLTQKDFGERIGVKQNTIGQYEIGRNEPTGTVFNLICKEFNVREEWLRNGEGEMFKPDAGYELEALAKRYDLPYGIQVVVEKLVTSNKDVQNAVLMLLLESVKPCLQEGVDPFARPSDNTGDVNLDLSLADIEAAYREELGIVPNTTSTALNTTSEDTTNERKEA